MLKIIIILFLVLFTLMEGVTFARRLFCTMVVLTQGKLMHGVTFARRHLLLDVTFVWRQKASLLHGVILIVIFMNFESLNQGSAALYSSRANFPRKKCSQAALLENTL